MKTAVRDGTRIDTTLRPGKPGAQRVLLVHSLALDRSVWEQVAALLGDDATLLTLDCRGHGASDAPPGPYALRAFAADCAEAMDAAGWERAVVAGSSMGGSVALAMAASHPARVEGLGLIDTTAWYGPEAEQNWNERADKAQREGLQGLLAFQRTRWFGDAFRAARPDLVERLETIFLRNDVAAYAATCRMMGAFDLRDGLGGIRVPTEILVGEDDYATPPAMARVLADGIPGARLTVLPGARHLTTVEAPDAVAALLRRLLARCAPTGAPR